MENRDRIYPFPIRRNTQRSASVKFKMAAKAIAGIFDVRTPTEYAARRG
jgi:hypothetical protein